MYHFNSDNNVDNIFGQLTSALFYYLLSNFQVCVYQSTSEKFSSKENVSKVSEEN